MSYQLKIWAGLLAATAASKLVFWWRPLLAEEPAAVIRFMKCLGNRPAAFPGKSAEAGRPERDDEIAALCRRLRDLETECRQLRQKNSDLEQMLLFVRKSVFIDP